MLSHTAARESLPKCFQLFQIATAEQRIAVRQLCWPKRLNEGGLYAGLGDLSTPKMRLFYLFSKNIVLCCFLRLATRVY